MNFLKTILAKYSEMLRAMLLPLGPFGIFAIAAVDAAFLGIPIDPLLVYFVFRQPSRFWLYVVMAAAGSALGSLVVYYIGRKGEELLLEKRMSKQRLERIKASFARHEALALVVPSLLPPPTPFKLFVLFAGAAHIPWRDVVLAIFAGRVVRFGTLALLTIWIGPNILQLTARLVREHLWLSFGVLAALIVAGFLLYRWRQRRG